MAFQCNVCGQYKSSKQRYKDGYVCKFCVKEVLGWKGVQSPNT